MADTVACSNAAYDVTTIETNNCRYFCMSLAFSTHHWVQYIYAIIHSKLVILHYSYVKLTFILVERIKFVEHDLPCELHTGVYFSC